MKRGQAAVALALALGCLAARADECTDTFKSAAPWIAEGESVRVAFVARPTPVPVGRHFELQFAVCSGAQLRRDARVQVDADMPAHRHGMNYRAAVSPLAERIAWRNAETVLRGAWQKKA